MREQQRLLLGDRGGGCLAVEEQALEELHEVPLRLRSRALALPLRPPLTHAVRLALPCPSFLSCWSCRAAPSHPPLPFPVPSPFPILHTHLLCLGALLSTDFPW